MVVIGDMPGNDKLCGRKQNYKATKSLDTGTCRECNVTFENCIDHRFKCEPLTRDFLKTISSKELEQLSFHDLEGLAFDNVSFGADEQGIYGCTPPAPQGFINKDL